MRTRSTVKSRDGITWYYEQEGTGPHVVLIPDGLGECGLNDKVVSLIAAAGFTVTTFDMPGMSRSRDAPVEAYTEVTARKLADQVVNLLDALDIQEPAAFYGCSSGGAAVLALVAYHPERVRNALPHEVPTVVEPHVSALGKGTDEDILAAVAGFPVRSGMVSPEDWEALGDDVHARLTGNYIVWGRGFPHCIPPSAAEVIRDGDILQRPMDWSVGYATPTGIFANNIVTATEKGIPFRVIPGSHFPTVSFPDKFAEYVIEVCRKYV